MVGPRTATALLGLVASLAVSAAAWWYLDFPFLFLFVPFVPFLLRRGRGEPPVRRCPECGFRTRDPGFDYCPRDGSRLELGDSGGRAAGTEPSEE